MYCVAVNSYDSAETTTMSTTVTTRAVCNTTASDMQNRSSADKPVPSMTSTVSVMIGNAKTAAAESAVAAPCNADGVQRASGRQQVSVAGDGSVVLTVLCSPMTADRPVSVCSAAAELTAGQPLQGAGIATVTESPTSRRFVVYICLCWIFVCFSFAELTQPWIIQSSITQCLSLGYLERVVKILGMMEVKALVTQMNWLPVGSMVWMSLLASLASNKARNMAGFQPCCNCQAFFQAPVCCSLQGIWLSCSLHVTDSHLGLTDSMALGVCIMFLPPTFCIILP